jgi:hypothetical protein
MAKKPAYSVIDSQESILKKACNLLEEKSAFIVVTVSGNKKKDFLERLAGHFQGTWWVLSIDKKDIDDSLIERLAALINVPKQKTISSLTADVNKKLTETNRKILLICDDAEIYQFEELETIRQLSNLPNSHKKDLSILLCGRPSLISKLNKKNCAAVKQRITGRLSLKDRTKHSLTFPFVLTKSLALIIAPVVVIALIISQFGGGSKDPEPEKVPVQSIVPILIPPKPLPPKLNYVFATEEEALASFKNVPNSGRKEKVAKSPLQQKIKAGKDWLLAQPDSYYTIQLFLLSNIETVTHNKQILAETQIIPILQKDKRFFGVYIGSFASLEAAKKAIPALPAHLAISLPFPKKISVIKTEITDLPE